jgi:hypothetical protein
MKNFPEASGKRERNFSSAQVLISFAGAQVVNYCWPAPKYLFCVGAPVCIKVLPPRRQDILAPRRGPRDKSLAVRKL